MKSILLMLLVAAWSCAALAQDSVTYRVGGKDVWLKVSNTHRAVRVESRVDDVDVGEELIKRTKTDTSDAKSIPSVKSEFVEYVIIDVSEIDSNHVRRYDRKLDKIVRRLDNKANQNLDELPVLTNGETLRLLPNEFILRFISGTSPQQKRDYFAREKIEVLQQVLYDTNEYLVTFRDKTPLEAIRRTSLALDPALIKYITPNFISIQPKGTPADSASQEEPDENVARQWYLSRVRVLSATEKEPSCWEIGKGDSVVIAILDEGVDTTHIDLKDKIVMQYDAVLCRYNQQPDASSSHGTACAGIAAASTFNGKGISGIAPNAKIMPVRIALNTSDGWLSHEVDIINGIRYAIYNGARVLNCSWAVRDESDALNNVIDEAIQHNCVLVFAAGNKGTDAVEYPGRLSPERKIITVSATTEDDQLKVKTSATDWGSQYGKGLTLVAPGVNIFTTFTSDNGISGYGYFNGTSGSAPLVSGAVALMLSVNRNLTVEDIMRIFATNCCDKFEDSRFGYGRLNIRNLVTAARDFKKSAEGNPAH